jgi:hypothetical protein
MDREAERRRFYRSHDPARLMALSDGVFAIVITLLVLEIHVPDLGGGRRLAEALDEIRPSFVPFLIWSSSVDRPSPQHRSEQEEAGVLRVDPSLARYRWNVGSASPSRPLA